MNSSSLTMLIVAALLCVECWVFYRYWGQRKAALSSGGADPVYPLMRPAIFLFLVSIDLCMAIIPLHMQRLSGDADGALFAWLIGLPISAEFLCVGIALLVGGVWADRSGWRIPFTAGLIIAFAGMVLSFMAKDPVTFIASRAIVGIGYGLIALSSQSFVIQHAGEKNRTQGLSHLFAGLYSGSICGAALGAFIADVWGYERVFEVSLLSVAAIGAYFAIFLVRMNSEAVAKAPGVALASKGALKRFLIDPKVIAAVFFSSMPASIAGVGLLNYFSPLFLNDQGVAETVIGQIVMLFGVVLTLLGPWAGKLTDRLLGYRNAMLMGGVLGGLSFLVFALSHSIVALIISIILLGCSNSLVLASQSAYVLSLESAKALGTGKVLGIFRSTSRIGQMLGPMIFSVIYFTADSSFALTAFGVCYLACILALALMTRSKTVSTDSLSKEVS
jgi:MFS family permease